MKKIMVTLLAVGLFAAMPAWAEHKKDTPSPDHTAAQSQMDRDCAKECELLIRDCTNEVDSIHQRIEKIKAAIKANGAKPENLEELRLLNNKLKETNETLRSLNKPGR